MTEESVNEMKAAVAYAFNVMSNNKPVVTKEGYEAAMSKIDADSYGLPDFDDFGKEVLDMDTYIETLTGALTTPGTVPEGDLSNIIRQMTQTFRQLAKDLGKSESDAGASGSEEESEKPMIPEMKQMLATVAWSFNVISGMKPTCGEKEWNAAMAKIDSKSFGGFPDFSAFESDVLDMDTYIKVFTGQFTTPGAVPDEQLKQILPAVTEQFAKFSAALGKPVPKD